VNRVRTIVFFIVNLFFLWSTACSRLDMKVSAIGGISPPTSSVPQRVRVSLRLERARLGAVLDPSPGHRESASLNRYVARTRVGFTPASREQLLARMRPLEIPECPFANLPEERSGRWGEGLTA
jgi:hypothetical protein